MSHMLSLSKRLLFTRKGIGVGVFTRNTALRSSENQTDSVESRINSTLSLIIFVGVESISGRIDLDLLIALIFRFYFRHQQSSVHWVISEGVVSEIGRKWKGKMEVYVPCSLSGELK